MIRDSLMRTAPLGAMAFFTACGLIPTTAVEVTQVEVRLELATSQVPTGGSVTAELQVVNTGTEPVTLRADDACMAILRVERGGVDQGFRTLPAPCWAAPPRLVLDPGDTVRHGWTVVAETVTGAAAAAGAYNVVVEMMGHLERNSILPGVIRSLVVLD